ncbi:hypothetical protein ACFY2W_06560 [Streptomyces sp. NPDC001262]|uniref:hypothetical protein n=1 Tax=Streptomyces sp. NPDC001262 TaxID=3364552 RepID=UPI0036B4B10C
MRGPQRAVQLFRGLQESACEAEVPAGHVAADTGAKLKDLMVRAGQSSERAQLIYQHSTKKHQRKLAADIDADVRRQRVEAADDTEGATIHHFVPRARETDESSASACGA